MILKKGTIKRRNHNLGYHLILPQQDLEITGLIKFIDTEKMLINN